MDPTTGTGGNSSCGRTGCSGSVSDLAQLFGAAADIVHVDGMVPIAIRHESVLDIEPISGLAMHMKKRTQMNSDYSLWESSVWYNRLWVEGAKAKAAASTAVVAAGSSGSESSHRMWLPLYWVEEGGSISAGQSASFKDRIYTPLWYKKKIPVICLLVGACAVSLSVLFMLIKLKNRIMVAPVRDPNQLSEVDERFNAAFKPNSAFRRTSNAGSAPTGMGPQASAAAAKKKKKQQRAGSNKVGIAPKPKSSANKMPSTNPFARSPKKKAASAEGGGGGASGKIGGGGGSPSKKVVRGGGDKKGASKKIVRGGGDKKKEIVRGGGDKKKVVRGAGQKIMRGGGQK